MENKHQSQSEQMTDNEQLIAYCGIYCKACPSFTSGKCEGCRGNSTKCAVVYKKCQVRPCCIENGFFTCADCTKYESTKGCKKYNPLSIRFGEWISSTSRRKGIEMIKEKGEAEFAAFMENKNWVCFKIKDCFFNKRFGKKVNDE